MRLLLGFTIGAALGVLADFFLSFRDPAVKAALEDAEWRRTHTYWQGAWWRNDQLEQLHLNRYLTPLPSEAVPGLRKARGW